MKKKKYKISIICPAYNHEKYIQQFIDSVLAQSIADFELLIVDDFSADNTVNIIKKYKDDRIKLLCHEYNKGFTATWEDLIKNASGEILCLSASDDILLENYLKEVIDCFDKDENLDVFYPSFLMINEENNLLPDRYLKLNPQLSKYEILRESFMEENLLPSPGMAVKKTVVEKMLPFPNGLLQYMDWLLHNKLLLADRKIKCSDKFLLKYRVSDKSASARNLNVLKREACETWAIMEPFLEIKDILFFEKIFAGLYEEFGKPTKETIPYFIARLAIKSKLKDKQRWGYETLIKYITKRENFDLLHQLYGIDFKSITNTVSECNYIQDNNESVINNKIKQKYKKYKRLSLILFILLIVFSLLAFGEIYL